VTVTSVNGNAPTSATPPSSGSLRELLRNAPSGLQEPWLSYYQAVLDRVLDDLEDLAPVLPAVHLLLGEALAASAVEVRRLRSNRMAYAPDIRAAQVAMTDAAKAILASVSKAGVEEVLERQIARKAGRAVAQGIRDAGLSREDRQAVLDASPSLECSIWSIVPAVDGWRAVFFSENDITGDLFLWEEPIVTWALVHIEYPSGETKHQVQPVVCGSVGFPTVLYEHEASDRCVGTLAPEQSLSAYWAALSEKALAIIERRRRWAALANS
jgi:hypothetical protein